MVYSKGQKHWRKTKRGWQKGKYTVYIIKNFGIKREVNKNYGEYYSPVLHYPGLTDRSLVRKARRTKKEAIIYAINWMEKN